jgi:hypothetical protein
MFFEVLDKIRLVRPRTLEGSILFMELPHCFCIHDAIEVVHKKSTLLLVLRSLFITTIILLGLLNLCKKILLNVLEAEKLRDY